MARTKATATEAERRSVARKANHAKKKYEDLLEPEKTTNVDPMDMTDIQLLNALRGLGAVVGPVVDGTRAVYQRKLGKLMKQKGLTNINEIGPGVEQEQTKIKKGKKNEKVKHKTESIHALIPQKKKEKTELISVMKEKDVGIVEDEDEEAKRSIESQVDNVKIDEKLKGRRTRSKKLSFAMEDAKEKKSKAEDDNTEEIRVQMKKRDPSVQIIDVRSNEIKNKSNEIQGNGLINRTVLIDEEEEKKEEEEEGDMEANAVANSILTLEKEDVGEVHLIPSDREEGDENEREVEYREEEDEVENSPQCLPIKIRPRFSVESHSESILRRSQLNREISSSEEEEEKEEGEDSENDERRMTIDMFNRKSRDTLIEEGRKSRQPLPRKMSLILEESVDMDVSAGSIERTTITDKAKQNYPLNDSEEMDISNGSQDDNDSSLRIFRDLSRRLYIDDSVYMDVSNRPRDDTLKLKQVDKNASILIVDTPKSSRMSIKKNDTSLYGPRNIRKMVEQGEDKEDTFRIPQSILLKGNLMSNSPNISFPLEDTFTNYPKGYLEQSVGGDTFNRGIEREGRYGMNSTRNSEATALSRMGKTFVVKNSEMEMSKLVNDDTYVISRNPENVVSDATFVIPRRNENSIHEREKNARLTRNIVRSPSRSPVRNIRRTYAISQSPSRINSTRKSPIVSTPCRSRPPKPMPRRIKPQIECDVPSTCSSVAPAPSQLDRPVPAPRRIPPSLIRETRKSLFDGRNIVNEKKDDGISPASLFLTQPSLRMKKAQLERESTPIDRENIKKLESLRDQMRQKKKEEQPVFELDTEARLIIEDAPHLKPFFY